MRLGHRGARLDAQFLDQAGAQVAVEGQGLGLAAGAVEGQHQLAVEGLAQRMGGDQLGEFGHQGPHRALVPAPAEFQFGVVPHFEGEQPRLLQARHQGVPVRLRQAAQRGAAPQREGGPGGVRGPRPGARGVCGPRVCHPLFEDAYVQLALFHAQPVAGRHRPQPAGVVEEPAKPRHVVVQGGLRGGGRRARPQGVLEGVDGDRAARLQEQRGQQGAPLGAAHGPRLAAVVEHGRRPEQPEPQPVPHAHAAPLRADP